MSDIVGKVSDALARPTTRGGFIGSVTKIALSAAGVAAGGAAALSGSRITPAVAAAKPCQACTGLPFCGTGGSYCPGGAAQCTDTGNGPGTVTCCDSNNQQWTCVRCCVNGSGPGTGQPLCTYGTGPQSSCVFSPTQ